MRHRAWGGYLIGLKEQRLLKDPLEIANSAANEGGAIGYCISGGETWGQIHGSIYNGSDKPVYSALGGNPEALAEVMRGVDGDYALAVPVENGLVFARDPLGVKPLFVGRRGELVGLASEAKALKAVGLDAESVRPGVVYCTSPQGIMQFPIHRVTGSGKSNVSLEEAAEVVLSLIRKSVEIRMRGRRVALGFSGGVDSSLLALLASQLGDIQLVSVYTSGSRDENGAKAAARLLGLDLMEIYLTQEEVAKKIEGIVRLIERQGAMDIAIGLAINVAAEAARREGCDCLMLGQLADELFGGYQRYLNAYSTERSDIVHSMMLTDTIEAYSSNFERDEEAASPATDLMLPYASVNLVDYALSLHPNLKLDLEGYGRKIVLRKAALNAGVPVELAKNPKKALQFSTNLQKLVKKNLNNIDQIQ
jgi:asparagine synthase (glutamine-hydrolysing)